MKKWVKLGGGVLAGFSVILFVVVGVIYQKTIETFHHPSEERDPISSTPADFGMEYKSLTLTTSDGLNLAAWYIPSRNGAAVIAQHGYKSDRTVMLNIASILSRHGYGVIMVDLRSHGMSEGELITLGKLEQLDVDAAYQYLLTRPDVDSERIGGIGNSMGGATLLMYAASNSGIKAVVAHSSFARAEDVAATNLEEYTGLPPLPIIVFLVQFFAEQHTGFESEDVAVVEYIGRISPRPVLLLQGGQDEEIPSESGYRLYEAAGEPRELWYEPEQEHVFFDRDYPEEFERRVVGFFDKYLLDE